MGFCIALVWVATLWLLYKHYRCVLWLNRSPRRSEIGQSFYLNFTSRGIPAANGFNSCQHVRWTRLEEELNGGKRWSNRSLCLQMHMIASPASLSGACDVIEQSAALPQRNMNLSHTLMPQTSGIRLCLPLSPPEKATQITGSICCKPNHDWCAAFLGCGHMFTPFWCAEELFFAF